MFVFAGLYVSFSNPRINTGLSICRTLIKLAIVGVRLGGQKIVQKPYDDMVSDLDLYICQTITTRKYRETSTPAKNDKGVKYAHSLKGFDSL